MITISFVPFFLVPINIDKQPQFEKLLLIFQQSRQGLKWKYST